MTIRKGRSEDGNTWGQDEKVAIRPQSGSPDERRAGT